MSKPKQYYNLVPNLHEGILEGTDIRYEVYHMPGNKIVGTTHIYPEKEQEAALKEAKSIARRHRKRNSLDTFRYDPEEDKCF